LERVVELHVVTGKGGTGKTTVAAALGLALAASGRTTLVIEVEGRQGLARLFDVAPLPYEEVRVAPAPDGGDVFGLAVDPEAAFYEYLDLFYRLGPAVRALRRVGAVDFATTVAPGLRDVLLAGKVYEAVGRRRSGRRTYDAVVLDAPPTGRITRFLDVGTQVSGLAKVGPVRAQADALTGLFRSDRTLVHLVTLLEEMPVQETQDALEELAGAGIAAGSIVVNRAVVPVIGDRALALLDAPPLGDVATVLKRIAVPRPVSTANALLQQGRDHRQRRALEDGSRATVQALGRPVVELPFIDGGIDQAALMTLAGPLRTHAMDQGWR
jgi:anion-transporting  ArsA/GET3 family ATPase